MFSSALMRDEIVRIAASREEIQPLTSTSPSAPRRSTRTTSSRGSIVPSPSTPLQIQRSNPRSRSQSESRFTDQSDFDIEAHGGNNSNISGGDIISITSTSRTSSGDGSSRGSRSGSMTSPGSDDSDEDNERTPQPQSFMNFSYYQFDPLVAYLPALLPFSSEATGVTTQRTSTAGHTPPRPPRSMRLRPRVPQRGWFPQGRAGFRGGNAGLYGLLETYLDPELDDEVLELTEEEAIFVLVVLGTLSCMFGFMLFVTIMTFVYTESAAN